MNRERDRDAWVAEKLMLCAQWSNSSESLIRVSLIRVSLIKSERKLWNSAQCCKFQFTGMHSQSVVSFVIHLSVLIMALPMLYPVVVDLTVDSSDDIIEDMPDGQPTQNDYISDDEPVWKRPRLELPPRLQEQWEMVAYDDCIIDTIKFHRAKQSESLLKQSEYVLKASQCKKGSEKNRRYYMRKSMKHGMKAQRHEILVEELESKAFHGVNIILEAFKQIEEDSRSEVREVAEEIRLYNETEEEVRSIFDHHIHSIQ